MRLRHSVCIAVIADHHIVQVALPKVTVALALKPSHCCIATRRMCSGRLMYVLSLGVNRRADGLQHCTAAAMPRSNDALCLPRQHRPHRLLHVAESCEIKFWEVPVAVATGLGCLTGAGAPWLTRHRAACDTAHCFRPSLKSPIWRSIS